jgi:hypothetical protein
LDPSLPQIPVALASSLSERRVRPALDRLNLARSFAAVVTAEDNASPDLEPSYLSASHQIQRPPLRCVVVGDSNRSVEAAHELGMKSVVVTGGQPAWNFGGADLVVRNLGQLSVVNLKNLFGQEDLVEPSVPWEEIKKQQEEDYEAQLSSASSGGFGFARGGGGGSSSGSYSSDQSSGAVWDPDAEEEGAGLAGMSWDREPALAASAGARAGGGGAAWREQGAAAAADEGEEEFDVILPPKGSAFWDLQR